RMIFYIVLPIVLIDLVVASFVMKNVTKRTFPKVDILSIILSSFGFGGLLYGFSMAGNPDGGWTSIDVMIALIVGVVTLTAFILRQLRMKHPMLEFRVFKYAMFSVATALGMIVFMGL